MIANAKPGGKPAPAASERALRQAHARPLECPACHAAEEMAAAMLRSFGEPGATADERNGGGGAMSRLCNTHAWRLARQPASARRLAATRLRANLERLAALEAQPSGQGRRREAGTSFGAEDDCPICAAMADAATALLRERHADVDSPLCLPHCCQALQLAHGREHVRAVAQHGIDNFSALEADLSELIRKSDYRFRGEPRGQEASSWQRAAHLVAGSAAVRWPLRRAPGLEG